jgi:hypothetical protein
MFARSSCVLCKSWKRCAIMACIHHCITAAPTSLVQSCVPPKLALLLRFALLSPCLALPACLSDSTCSDIHLFLQKAQEAKQLSSCKYCKWSLSCKKWATAVWGAALSACTALIFVWYAYCRAGALQASQLLHQHSLTLSCLTLGHLLLGYEQSWPYNCKIEAGLHTGSKLGQQQDVALRRLLCLKMHTNCAQAQEAAAHQSDAN